MAVEIFSPEIATARSMHTPGMILWDDRGNAWLYIKAAENLTANHVVMVQKDFANALMITTGRLSASADEGSARLGIPKVAIADNEHGWIQVYGPALVETNGGISNLESYSYSTSVAGKLDDSSSGTHRTRNIVFWTAPSSAGTAECMMNWPGGVRYV